ncbi:hypothetical protein [Aminiphilus circumscriptus]|jgi:hypothetical protein|uniref:hypothetical protein n=1 Tax=Aminiphilus circumscriptus TaxID=290732 RepID=UPI0004929B9F|nr:hypothetical protein [Aminiphilus circumscriptus]
MAATRRTWGLLLLTAILGTVLGIFCQRIPLLAPYFRTLAAPGLHVETVDLIFAVFGFKFFLQINLGTLLGGVVGLWLVR